MNQDNLIIAKNTDSYGNELYSVPIPNEKHVVFNNRCIQLLQCPDKFQGIEITDESGIQYIEVYNFDEVEDNPMNVYINYPNGICHFNSAKIGKTVSCKYNGLGLFSIDSSRVIYRDEANNIVETLKYLIDQGYLGLKALAEFGSASEIVKMLELKITEGNNVSQELESNIAEGTPLQQNLHADITEAKKWKDTLHSDVAEGKVLQPKIHQDVIDAREADASLVQAINLATPIDELIRSKGNDFVEINTSDWSESDSDGFYSYTWNHRLNSDEPIFQTFEWDSMRNKWISCLIIIEPIDKDSVLVKSDNNLKTRINANARTYSGITI